MLYGGHDFWQVCIFASEQTHCYGRCDVWDSINKLIKMDRYDIKQGCVVRIY